MGITYQTSNRLRRKVMTAPLQAVAEAPQAEPVAPAPARRSMSARWLSMSAAGAAVLAALFAARAL